MAHDPHSFSVPSEAKVTHLRWRANVDFEKRMISATAEWEIEMKPDAAEIIFDTKGLDIQSVTLDNGVAATFRAGY